MIVTAVIPVSGREPLLRYVIGRLKHQTVPINVLCCGHTESERAVCESEGADFFFADEGESAGSKWQKLIDISRYAYNTEAILILGSSNMISHNWVEELSTQLADGIAMVGVQGLYYADIWKNGDIRMFHWGGYSSDSGRYMEPVGTGRMIHKSVLDKIDWRLYPDQKSVLDLAVTKKVFPYGKLLLSQAHVKGVRVSSFLWRQINKYDALAGMKQSHMLTKHDIDSLLVEFPEIRKFAKELSP